MRLRIPLLLIGGVSAVVLVGGLLSGGTGAAPGHPQMDCGDDPEASGSVTPDLGVAGARTPGEAAAAFVGDERFRFEANPDSATTEYLTEDGAPTSRATDRARTVFEGPVQPERIVEIETGRGARGWYVSGFHSCAHYVEMDETQLLPPGAAPDGEGN